MFGKSILRSYSGFINVFSRFSDPLAIAVAAFVAYGLRFSFSEMDLPKDYRILVLFSILCTVLIFPMFGMYDSWRGKGLLSQARAIMMAWLTVGILIIVILFVLKISAGFSRLWLVWWMLLGMLFLIVFRMTVFGYLQYQRKRGKNIRHIIIVGAGELGVKVVNRISNSPWMGFKIMGLFDDNEGLLESNVDDVKVIGSISDVEQYISKHEIDEIWIALPLRSEKRMKELLHEIRFYTVNIKLVPDIFGFSLMNHSITEIAGLPVVNISKSPMDGANSVLKRVEDVFIALTILLIVSPLMLVLAIGVKFSSSGPVFYRQERVSWNGGRFMMYKFRSMPVDNEKNGVVWGGAQGKEATGFGKFLRKTSLDELPQFFNVLVGDMSIVGPRPERTEFVDKFKSEIPGYMQKHMVKAGITGWAQVNGWRGDTCLNKRIECDLYYIENWSLWFDLKIIFLTIFKGFINKNAY